jgi:hypothetical protein
MTPNRVLEIHHRIEAAGISSLKTQSPSTFRWRLRVEVRHSCRFETSVTFGHTGGPHGQSPLPGLIAPLILMRMASCRTHTPTAPPSS